MANGVFAWAHVIQGDVTPRTIGKRGVVFVLLRNRYPHLIMPDISQVDLSRVSHTIQQCIPPSQRVVTMPLAAFPGVNAHIRRATLHIHSLAVPGQLS